MKKVTVDLMLGRKSRSHFRKIVPKSNIVAAQLPAATAIKTSSYGLRFGKTGLNTGEICEKFNVLSKPLWKPNLLLPVVVFVSPTKSYVMEIKYPTIYTLLNVIFDMASNEEILLDLPKYNSILLRIFYKIALIKANSVVPENLEKTIRQIIGTSYSCDMYNPWRKKKTKIQLQEEK